MQENNSYNQKIFSGGLQAGLQRFRFERVKEHFREAVERNSLLGLGRFDTRSLDFFERLSRYLGADAGRGSFEGIPFRKLPYLSFQVGIVAKPKV